MKKLKFILIVLFTLQYSFAQSQHKVESLKIELQKAKHDTTRLRLYLALGDACDIEDNLLYAEPALRLCDKLLSQTSNDSIRKKILSQRAIAYGLINYYYSETSKTDSLKKVLSTQKEDTNKVNTLNYTSNFRYNSGDYVNAMKYAEEAKLLSEKINFKKGEGNAFIAIGHIYRQHKNNKDALNNYFIALKLHQESNDKEAIATTYKFISVSYGNLLDYPNSLKYCYLELRPLKN